MQDIRLTRTLTVVMAIATGLIVANLYYLQPLVQNVTVDFRVSKTAAASVVTCLQLGYAFGLLFIVPLGDMLRRRRLIVALFIGAALAMATGAFVSSFLVFAVVSILIGVVSVGAQVMVPFAADLARPDQRGRIVARLMTGLLTGILLSRTLSGLVAQQSGWRAVYWIAAAAMAGMALILRFVLPAEPRRSSSSYRHLLKGTFHLFMTLPELRRRSWLGAVCFAAFGLMWTTLSFKLSAPPFQYNSGLIGMFGLLGVAGVVAANGAGSLADANKTRGASLAAASMIVVAFVILGIGKSSIVAVIIGVIVLDIGVQGMQITNQSIIYGLAPESRSRINSAYMFCYFIGGAVGSMSGGIAYTHGGWNAVCIVGMIYGIAAIVPAVWHHQNTQAKLRKRND